MHVVYRNYLLLVIFMVTGQVLLSTSRLWFIFYIGYFLCCVIVVVVVVVVVEIKT